MAVEARPMPREFWFLITAGVVSLLFGLAAVLWPGLTLLLLVLLFGAYAVVTGIVHLIAMFRAIGTHRTWWPDLILGVVSLAAGLYVLALPVEATFVLLWVIALWAIVVGLTEVIDSLVTGRLFLLAAGLLAIVFGFVLLGNLAAGALALVTVIGIFAIVRGVLLIAYGFSRPARAPA